MRTNLKYFTLFALCGVSIFSQGSSKAYADDKTCTVMLQQSLNDSDEGKKNKTAIEADMNAKKKQLDSLKVELKAKKDDLDKQKMVLSKEVLETKANELQTKFMELQQKAMEFENQLKQKESESVQKILTAQKAVAIDLAKQKGCTNLYENSAEIILFSKSAEDITSAVIQAYNASPKK